MTLAIWDQYPLPFHPESPKVTAVTEGLAVGSPFVSILSSLRAHFQGGCSGYQAIRLQHPLFTDMAGPNIFHLLC